ncbi:hypothetical protein ACUOI0_23580, partial [Escherichia coli]
CSVFLKDKVEHKWVVENYHRFPDFAVCYPSDPFCHMAAGCPLNQSALNTMGTIGYLFIM